jgi:outer membrane lipoprotein LolB
VNARRALIAAGAALALASCATVPPAASIPAPAPAPADARAALAAFDGWRAAGRVAVKTAADGWSANFDWLERDGRGELGVRGPFGAGAARITRTADLIRIEQGGQPPVDVPAPFDTLEPVLRERLGAPLPLGQLRWWLLGVPAPDEPVVASAQGFEQSGWTVRVDEYAAVAGAPAPLPRRLVLEREATRIRVIVDRWDSAAP